MARTEPGTTRPGGRTARTREAVHQAAGELLADPGRGRFTLRDVATRSGVHEATLHRRWGGLDNVLLDAAVSQLNRTSPVPDTGSLAGDLRGWAASVAESIGRPGGLAFLQTVLAARTAGPEGADGHPHPAGERAQHYLGGRTDQIRAALERARHRGEPAPDFARVMDRLLAPIYLRAVFGYRDPGAELDALVEDTLLGSPRPVTGGAGAGADR